MLTLCIRTDKPEAELYLYDGSKKIAEVHWQAHRKLAETIHQKIDELFNFQGLSLEISFEGVEKVCVYQGPGSFTGLRIGLSVANTIAYSLDIPIAGAEGENWLEKCIKTDGSKEPIRPIYGADPHITKQKK